MAKFLSAEVRASQEFQSAVIRLSVWAFMLPLLAVAHYFGDYGFTWGQYLLLFGVHLFWYTWLLVSAYRRPALWPARTYVSIIADLSGTTGALFLTGDATGPFYLLYAVSFLSQGMRYGSTNLLIASLCSLVAFTVVAVVLGAWKTQPLEVGFVALVLIVLPAYEYTLLRKLNRARQAAETANRARGDFLATMTHELRTPLSGVIGMAGLLKRTQLDEEQRDYVDSINTSADVLQSLIGDILDLSKIDAGKLELKDARFHLRDSLSETCWVLSNQAADKNVELICRVDPTLPEEVLGDELRLRQILFNLIGNAVKFTEKGYIVVHATLAPPGVDIAEAHLRVDIRDTGIGIPADRVGKVFDSFWQADPSSTRRYGGTGLGTSIARDLTRLMGGVISVESEEGRGSTFSVRLPFLRAGLSSPRALDSLQGLRALVLESEEESANAIVEACEAAGMAADVVGNVERINALEMVSEGRQQRVALIADAPRGLDLDRLANLVRRALGSETPLVYLHYPRRKLASADPGAARAFKPINTVQLWDAIAQAIGVGAQAVPAAVSGDGSDENRELGHVLVAEDDDINAKLINSLLGRFGCHVTLVRDGQAALDATEDQHFDLALIDLRMPRMDGIDFTRAVRERETPGTHLPIIALTANAAEDARRECLQAGMDDFLTKPVDPQFLQELLLRHGVV